ncbi:MAG: type II toxin-antitoxin system VapC family toxin [Micrococcales bacterium]|jgi:predicted nucleic acid-binding protein|nr:type II toxin-antitoxin system VapC family toxin [Micrococcales bacterium]
MITLDASCLIAHFERADPHHDQASAIMEIPASGELQIHTINSAEVLVGGVRGGRVNQMLAAIQKLGVVTVPPIDDEALRLAELRYSTGLKLPGCCALLAAMTNGQTLATFDQTLAEAGRHKGLQVLGHGQPN